MAPRDTSRVSPRNAISLEYPPVSSQLAFYQLEDWVRRQYDKSSLMTSTTTASSLTSNLAGIAASDVDSIREEDIESRSRASSVASVNQVNYDKWVEEDLESVKSARGFVILCSF